MLFIFWGVLIWYFAKMSLNWELCFSHDYTGVTGFGMKPTEVKCLLSSSYQGYMPSTRVSTADGDPGQLAEAESSRILPIPSYIVLFRNKSLSRVHTSEVGFYALPLQCCIYTKCLEFLYGGLITSLPYIYLVIYISMNSWLFILHCGLYSKSMSFTCCSNCFNFCSVGSCDALTNPHCLASLGH